jgi:hypothetical protein
MADVMITANILDDDGDTKQAHVFLAGAATDADIGTFAAFWIPLLDAVIDGKIKDASVTKPLTLPGGLKAAAVALSEVQKGANFSFLNASRYKYGTWVPSFKPTLFSGDIVNQAGAGVAAFIASYVAGTAGIAPTNGFGFDLTALARATKNFRK